MLCKEPSRGICGGMYRWGRLTLMAKVQNEEPGTHKTLVGEQGNSEGSL